MEKQSKTQCPVGCYKLLKWSCLLLKWSQFTSVSKGGFLRLATAQAFLCQILMHGSFRERRACKKLFFNLFSQVSCLLEPLAQLVKTGFTKATQRRRSVSQRGEKDRGDVSKLTNEDCITCIYLLEVLLVEHLQRFYIFAHQTYLSCNIVVAICFKDLVKHFNLLQGPGVLVYQISVTVVSLCFVTQLLLYLICHPSWDIRKIAYDSTCKIISASLVVVENLLLEFRSWLSLITEKMLYQKLKYVISSILQFLSSMSHTALNQVALCD
ncbi:hypothetical protein GW17_00003261 [Ensete ventricosum]|nr:hypothetical protein GW17_00003261 [Ensete ventricosum]